MKTTPNRPPQIRPYRAAWDPKAYVYTDGSLVTGNPTLGASIVNPNTQTTTHIEVKSQPKRHTINRAIEPPSHRATEPSTHHKFST